MSTTVKDTVFPFAWKRSGERTNNGGTRTKPRRCRGPAQNDRREKAPGWRRRGKRRHGRRSDGLDHPRAHEAHRAPLRDLESSTYCTLSVLRDSAIVMDVQDPGRAHQFPDEERGSSHICFCMGMLQAVERILGRNVRRGNGGSSGAALEDSRSPEAARIECMGESAQASPNLRKAWSTTHVEDHLRCRGFVFYKWEESGRSVNGAWIQTRHQEMDWLQMFKKCGTEGSEYHRLYECEAHRRRRIGLPNGNSKRPQQAFTRGLAVKPCYEWVDTEHKQEKWTRQSAWADGGRKNMKLDLYSGNR